MPRRPGRPQARWKRTLAEYLRREVPRRWGRLAAELLLVKTAELYIAGRHRAWVINYVRWQ